MDLQSSTGSAERPSGKAAETTEVHTQVLRLALGVQEARAYWQNVDPRLSPTERSRRAFEGRWFGAKSAVRVKTLLQYFALRFDAFPSALAVLRRWPEMEPATRQVICHWHLQLTDPIYRAFTGELLLERRTRPNPSIDRDVVARWLRTRFADRWAEATILQFASKLLSAAYEAGLVSGNRDPRELTFPKVSDAALCYLLYLLRETEFAATLTENPYLGSVGLDHGILFRRLKTIPDVAIRQLGSVIEVDWAYPSLVKWAEARL